MKIVKTIIIISILLLSLTPIMADDLNDTDYIFSEKNNVEGSPGEMIIINSTIPNEYNDTFTDIHIRLGFPDGSNQIFDLKDLYFETQWTIPEDFELGEYKINYFYATTSTRGNVSMHITDRGSFSLFVVEPPIVVPNDTNIDDTDFDISDSLNTNLNVNKLNDNIAKANIEMQSTGNPIILLIFASLMILVGRKIRN